MLESVERVRWNSIEIQNGVPVGSKFMLREMRRQHKAAGKTAQVRFLISSEVRFGFSAPLITVQPYHSVRGRPIGSPYKDGMIISVHRAQFCDICHLSEGLPSLITIGENLLAVFFDHTISIFLPL
jgi:hypothetical protein